MATTKSRRIMGKSRFEQYVHSILHDHTMSVDTEDIWAGVESTLPKKGGSNGWILALSGIVLLTVSGLLLWPSNKADDPRSSSSKEQVLAVNVDRDQQKDISTIKEQTTVSSTGIETTSTVTTNNEATSLKSNSSSSRQETTTTDDSSQTLYSIANKNNGSQSSEQSQLASASLSNSSKSNSNKVGQTSNSFNQNTSSFILNFPNVDGSSSILTTRENEESITNSGKSSLRSLFSPIDYLTNNRKVDQISFLNQDLATIIATPNLNDCYSFNGRSFGLAVDVYSGINYASKNLKAQGSEPVGSNYIQSRKNSENYLEAFEAGINLNLIHRSGLMASTGFNYSQIDEEFNYFSVHSETRFDSVLVRIIIDSTGQADSIREWRPTTVQTAREVLAYNYFRSVDIPLAIGYQFHRNKWTIEAQGGVLFNLLFKKKGQILSPNLNEMPIDDNSQLFKDRMGLTAFASIKALYPVSDRIALYAEPFGRFNLKSITVPEYALSQRYNQYGIRLGARVTI